MENQINTEPNNSLPEPVVKKSFLSTLSKGQKTSLFVLVTMIVTLPITTALALIATRLNSKAYLPSTPPTPPITVTVTPTSTPSATPTSTPSATPTATSTNRPPTITTSKLPIAVIKQRYSASIEAFDPDKGDKIKVTISGLPAGITQLGDCASLGNSSKVVCKISGIASKVGVYQVQINVTDNKRAITAKTISLTVQAKK